MSFNKVSGSRNKHRVVLYALSTCGWCRKTKELLAAEDVEHEYVDVDLLEGLERKMVSDEVRALNPRGNYPVLQIDEQVIVGYDPDKTREALSR
ncbi:MAG: glutaredoxin family protein [Deltaproteobacteria bacterium]|nr:glutaredoxin family protein [Deltaproteobacteria bacterium]